MGRFFRLPFAKWGMGELLRFGGGSLILMGLSLWGALGAWMPSWLGWILTLVFALLALFVIWFFRDPEREIPGGDLDIVSPADGEVTDATIGERDSDAYIEGKAHVLGIFLNVFSVHVNRSPLQGEVEFLRYQAGKFLDARDPKCGVENEQQIVGMRADKAGNAKCLIKQISGLIARRIVCPLEPKDRLDRGERFGMIKFGSRTELWIDAADAEVEWLVKPGDKVKGGSTIVGRIKAKRSESGEDA